MLTKIYVAKWCHEASVSWWYIWLHKTCLIWPYLLDKMRFRDSQNRCWAKGQGNVSPKCRVSYNFFARHFFVFKIHCSNTINSVGVVRAIFVVMPLISCMFLFNSIWVIIKLNEAMPLVKHPMEQYIFIRARQTGWWLLLQSDCRVGVRTVVWSLRKERENEWCFTTSLTLFHQILGPLPHLIDLKIPKLYNHIQ